MTAEKYIHNLKKIILKRAVYSPIDFEKKPTTSIYGTLSCGAVVPYQILSRRPIPELGCYRTPLHNIYMCCVIIQDLEYQWPQVVMLLK
jgi:phytoene dehydrogenase-like protein